MLNMKDYLAETCAIQSAEDAPVKTIPPQRSAEVEAASVPEADTILDNRTVTELVAAINDGQVSPESLPMAKRQQCVDRLTLDGFSNSDIAELMHISERTVRRDRAAIRRDHAVEPDRRLGDELMGEFQRLILASVQRLVRLANDPQTPAYARLWVEEAIVRNYQRLIDTAHRLHYFENGAQRLREVRLLDPAEIEREKQIGRAQIAITKARAGIDDNPLGEVLKKLMG